MDRKECLLWTLNSNSKKDGQRYSKSELLKHGWTSELIREHLPEMRRNNGPVYFRASDVRTAIESDAALAEQLMANRAEHGLRSQLIGTPIQTRIELAKRLAPILQEAYEAAEMPPDIRIVSNQWHRLFWTAFYRHIPLETRRSIVSSLVSRSFHACPTL